MFAFVLYLLIGGLIFKIIHQETQIFELRDSVSKLEATLATERAKHLYSPDRVRR